MDNSNYTQLQAQLKKINQQQTAPIHQISHKELEDIILSDKKKIEEQNQHPQKHNKNNQKKQPIFQHINNQEHISLNNSAISTKPLNQNLSQSNLPRITSNKNSNFYQQQNSHEEQFKSPNQTHRQLIPQMEKSNFSNNKINKHFEDEPEDVSLTQISQISSSDRQTNNLNQIESDIQIDSNNLIQNAIERNIEPDDNSAHNNDGKSKEKKQTVIFNTQDEIFQSNQNFLTRLNQSHLPSYLTQNTNNNINNNINNNNFTTQNTFINTNINSNNYLAQSKKLYSKFNQNQQTNFIRNSFELLQIHFQQGQPEKNEFLSKQKRFNNILPYVKDLGSKLLEDKKTKLLIIKLLQNFLTHLQIKPNSKIKILWDVIVTIINIICVFLVSIQICFTPKGSVWRQNFSLYFVYSSIFMLASDILLSFLTGYYQQGVLQTNIMEISKMYIKNQLLIDILSFIGVVAAIQESQNYTYFFLSLLILLKFLSIKNQLSQFQEMFFTESNLKYFISMMKLFVVLVCIIHVGGCLYYGLGKYQMKVLELPQTWINTENAVSPILNDESWYNQYITTFFIIASLIMGEGVLLYPLTTYETLYIILMEIVTCIGTAYIISSMGQLLSNLDRERKQFYNDMAIINGFMKKKLIPFELQIRTRNYLEYQFSQQNISTNETEKTVLQKVPQKLREEIMKVSQKKIANILLEKYRFSQNVLEQASIFLEEIRFSDQDIVAQKNAFQDLGLYYLQSGNINFFYDSENKQKGPQLEQGKTFGHTEFVTGLPRNYQVLSKGISVIYFLERKKFLEVLKENQEDFENFMMLKDLVNFQHQNFNHLKENCWLCGEKSHFFINCQFSQFQPCKFEIYSKYLENEIQPQQKYRRALHIERSCQNYKSHGVNYLKRQIYKIPEIQTFKIEYKFNYLQENENQKNSFDISTTSSGSSSEEPIEFMSSQFLIQDYTPEQSSKRSSYRSKSLIKGMTLNKIKEEDFHSLTSSPNINNSQSNYNHNTSFKSSSSNKKNRDKDCEEQCKSPLKATQQFINKDQLEQKKSLQAMRSSNDRKKSLTFAQKNKDKDKDNYKNYPSIKKFFKLQNPRKLQKNSSLVVQNFLQDSPTTPKKNPHSAQKLENYDYKKNKNIFTSNDSPSPSLISLIKHQLNKIQIQQYQQQQHQKQQNPSEKIQKRPKNPSQQFHKENPQNLSKKSSLTSTEKYSNRFAKNKNKNLDQQQNLNHFQQFLKKNSSHFSDHNNQLYPSLNNININNNQNLNLNQNNNNNQNQNNNLNLNQNYNNQTSFSFNPDNQTQFQQQLSLRQSQVLQNFMLQQLQQQKQQGLQPQQQKINSNFNLQDQNLDLQTNGFNLINDFSEEFKEKQSISFTTFESEKITQFKWFFPIYNHTQILKQLDDVIKINRHNFFRKKNKTSSNLMNMSRPKQYKAKKFTANSNIKSNIMDRYKDLDINNQNHPDSSTIPTFHN